MKQKVTIGIVGLGYWGPNLLRNFSRLPDCNVKYGCDLDQAVCDRYTREYQRTTFTTSFDLLLEDKEIDAVVIATPISTHYMLAKKALEAGKHVLIEKPMASSSQEAEDLASIAKKKKLLCMVDHTFIYTGAVSKIKEIVSSGQLGTAYYFDSERINLGLIQEHHNVIWDLAPHDISILLHVFSGVKPVSVMATGACFVNGKNEEIANISINFDSCLVGNITVSWLSPVKIRKVIIGGSEKMIVYDDIDPSEKVRIYDKGVSFNADEVTPFNPLYRSGDLFIPKLDTTEPLEKEAIHFLRCVRGEESPLVSAEDGAMVVRILEACDRSLKEKREISIP